MIAARKEERWAAYKEMRGVASMVHSLTDKHIQEFSLPDDWVVRPIGPSEFRIVRRSDNVAIIHTVDADGVITDRRPEIPTDPAHCGIPLLVLVIDQGGVGTAFLFFMIWMGLMVDIRFDAFHRGVNDVKLATLHCRKSIFRRVQMFTSFIFALNYGPWGSSAFYDEKKPMLEYFYAMYDSKSPEFRRFAVKFAIANCVPHDTDEDFDDIYLSYYDLSSFNEKGPLPKASRWFSWYENYAFHWRELWALKTIVLCYFGDGFAADDNDDVRLVAQTGNDPREEVRQLRAKTGGFKLAYKLICDDLVHYARILFHVGRPCYNHHADRASGIKTPEQGALDTINMSRGLWVEEIQEISEASFRNIENLTAFGLLRTTADTIWCDHVAQEIIDLALHISEQRAWTGKLFYELPLRRYSGLLADSDAVRNSTSAQMHSEWQAILKLESEALRDLAALELQKDAFS